MAFLIAILAIGIGTQAARAQVPSTRAAEIEKARDQKQAALQPEEVSSGERFLRDLKDKKVLERLTASYNGLSLKIGNVVTGGGFALGPEYTREDLLAGRLYIRGLAQGTTKGYTKFEAEAGTKTLWNDRATLSVLASRRDYSSLNYYGPGPLSRKEVRSNYRLEDTALSVFAAAEVTRQAKVGASTGKLWTNLGPGTAGEFVSTDRLFTEARLPGIQRQTDYIRTTLFGQFDYRDNHTSPKAGGNYVFQYSWYHDSKLGLYGFRRTDIDLQQVIPFLNKTRRIALRAKGTFTENDAGQKTPFYLQPILGGSDDLRGYRYFRFNDRNAVVYNAEYQWEIFSGLDGGVFCDAGKVMPRRGLLAFSNLETDAGFGLRFNANNTTFLRIDVGFSQEGVQVWLKFNDLFVSRKFGTSAGQPVY